MLIFTAANINIIDELQINYNCIIINQQYNICTHIASMTNCNELVASFIPLYKYFDVTSQEISCQSHPNARYQRWSLGVPCCCSGLLQPAQKVLMLTLTCQCQLQMTHKHLKDKETRECAVNAPVIALIGNANRF